MKQIKQLLFKRSSKLTRENKDAVKEVLSFYLLLLIALKLFILFAYKGYHYWNIDYYHIIITIATLLYFPAPKQKTCFSIFFKFTRVIAAGACFLEAKTTQRISITCFEARIIAFVKI